MTGIGLSLVILIVFVIDVILPGFFAVILAVVILIALLALWMKGMRPK